MLGAIIGDIVGSVYEFININTKEFPFITESSAFTDDTVMTVAVAEGLMNSLGSGDEQFEMLMNSIGLDDEKVEENIISAMLKYAMRYPNAGYGARFFRWLATGAELIGEDSDGELLIGEKKPKPYGSYGNGSAMRVSSVGWLFNTEADVLKYAAISARITHNHPEGIKGAQATALAIYLARNGMDKEGICRRIAHDFGYDLNKTLADITTKEHGPEICQVTMPEALICFRESESYEDCIRNSVSIGGDSDTIAAISGSIAEAYYGIPEDIRAQGLEKLSEDMATVYARFLGIINTR
jgi:ADP-ribosylglycohydrolase